MDLIETLKESLNFAARQASDFVEIVRLKLRIIGFSNKRSGLFTRLGELTYNAVTQNRPVNEDDEIRNLVEESRLAGDEISAAEEAINRKKKESFGDREDFRKKRQAGRVRPGGAVSAGVEPQKMDEAQAGETSSAASGAVTTSMETEAGKGASARGGGESGGSSDQ